jgi:acetyl esterase/lipase
MNSILKSIWFALFILSNSMAFSQELKLEEIMAGDDFIGHQPKNIVWAADSKSFYFEWDNTDEYKAYYQGTLKSNKPTKIETKELSRHNYNGYFSSDNGVFNYSKRGNSIFKIENEQETEVFSYFDSYYVEKITNKGRLFITINNNLFDFDPTKGTFRQLTNFTKGNKPTKGQSPSYLEDQQLELFQIQKQRKLRKNKRDDFREKSRTENIKPIYLDGWSLDWIEMAEDGKWMIYELTKRHKNTSTYYPSYLNESGETELRNARPKVGSTNPEHKLLYYNFDTNEQKEFTFESLEGIIDLPEYMVKKDAEEIEPLDEPKEIIFHGHGFNKEQTSCLIEIKSYDNKDRWIVTIDQKGEYEMTEHQHDKAWIGGPGISGWNMVPGNVNWINDSQFFYQSEESGYSHLYTYDIDSKNKTQLTSGKFEIHEAYLNQNKSALFITANKSHPGNRDFLKLDLKTKSFTTILTGEGNHEVVVSPDESYLAIRYSSRNKPWEIYTAPLKENTKMRQITNSQSDKFKKYEWRVPEVITFKATDNENVNARVYEPKKDTKNGAAVIFVHGAGYLQNAHNWWSGYHREYMFNNLLADMGFTVLDIDYRASKGYGRDFRTGIYRYMGGKDLSDNMDGRQYLINKHDIDPDRIGMYGGSYGGFITLMALLTEPGKIKCGAAIRSVTDWAHYNHAYTSNILNTPDTDPEAFRISSPIYYAQNLEDKLLMLHGIEDDNVQYQDVVRLSQRFIEEGKKDWDLIGYPIEPHGFKETSSWVDEYGRILKLFETELLKK